MGGGRIVRTGTDLFHIFNLYPSLTCQMYDAHCRYFMIYYLLLLRKFRMPPFKLKELLESEYIKTIPKGNDTIYKQLETVLIG